MTTFVSAMDQTNRALTTNGDACLSTSGDGMLDLFFKLTRGLEDAELELLFSKALVQAVTPDAKADLMVLAFHTRGTRGIGKGERSLTYSLIALLAKAFGAEAVNSVLGLLPAFGYWKDLVYLLAMDASDKLPKAVGAKCEELLCTQLLDDQAELAKAASEARVPRLSLVGKYAPREGTSFDKKERGGLGKRLGRRLYGGANPATAARKYRKLCSALNAALNTTECLMAAGRWEEIRFGSVASLCLQRNRKAFLNESLKGALAPHEEATGNRHPDDKARVAARLALRQALCSGKGVQGGALMPHEIVQKCMPMSSGRLSTLERDLLDSQWTSMRAATLDAIKAAAAARAEAEAAETTADSTPQMRRKSIDLGKLVALVDVSGSMTGIPMKVSIALGILVSELTAPTFRHRVLTFETKPQWVDLSGCATIVHKVAQCEKASWGGSTDFEAACERILLAAKDARLEPDEIPDLIVFSDMQFDEASGGAPWETAYERIGRRFAEVGVELCGEPYPAPRIIFWNLRANTVGFPVAKDAPNVQMLSGFSPALLKLVLSGSDLVADEEEITLPDGTKKLVRAGPTPEQTLRVALDDPAFDIVRLKLAQLDTGPFEQYIFSCDQTDGEAGFVMVMDVS